MIRGSLFRAGIGSVAAVVVCAVAMPARVDAKVTFDSPYTLAQTYNSALRLVRVDLGLPVTEKDAAIAYVLFDYKSSESGQRVVPGSIQMLDAGRSVKVVVQLGAMPRYHEQVIVDALAKKLHDEYGEPAPRTSRREPADAGSDSIGPVE